MNRLRELRKRNKWTQADLEVRSGVPRSTISKIEQEIGPILLGHAKRIANAFGLKPEAVFTDGTRTAAYYHPMGPRFQSGRFKPFDADDPGLHLCHWCGFIYDPAEETPVCVRVNGHNRIYAHEKCRQEHLSTQAYA